jgi:hypothetical protein
MAARFETPAEMVLSPPKVLLLSGAAILRALRDGPTWALLRDAENRSIFELGMELPDPREARR